MQCIFYGTLLYIHVYAATCIRPIFRNILHNSFKDFHSNSYAAVWFFFLFYFVHGFSFTPATNGAFKIEKKIKKRPTKETLDTKVVTLTQMIDPINHGRKKHSTKTTMSVLPSKLCFSNEIFFMQEKTHSSNTYIDFPLRQ